MRQDPHAFLTFGRYLAKLFPLHAGDSIELGEFLVEKGVICIQQSENTLVVSHHVLEESIRFASHQCLDLVVPLWEQRSVRFELVQLSKIESLSCKVLYKFARPSMIKHPLDLSFQYHWIA